MRPAAPRVTRRDPLLVTGIVILLLFLLLISVLARMFLFLRLVSLLLLLGVLVFGGIAGYRYYMKDQTQR
jgi:hypothetical protein